LPRLKCTYREFIEILDTHGFEAVRQGATSHARWRGIVGGKVMLVTVAGSGGDYVLPDTLASMIRQSGLPKNLFRK
jgi:predicted RNA binding protein YcfA (HicA-like mRNA interferase family)